VPDIAIRAGFGQVQWPGRFEIGQRENPTVIFDAAHNEDSFAKLRATLEKYFPGRRVTLIFGVSEDKHLAEMLSAIQPLVQRVIVTRANHPRALGVDRISEMAERLGLSCEAAESVEKGLNKALELSQKDGSIVLSAGSIFVTAEAKQAFLKKIKG
jgi:dihydrofolate synthase/folylpolyglutamate synthase